MHGSSYLSRVNDFLDEISPIASKVPMMVAPGNHEAEDHTPVCLLSPDCRRGFGNFTTYNCVWEMPSGDRKHNMWYSFDFGPIHFVMTNTETDYEGAPLEPYGEVGFIPTGKFGTVGEYEQWLTEDIVNATKRPDKPFIIVVGHRPISVLDDKTDPFVTPLNERIIKTIGENAHVYVSGHVHYYARSIPQQPHVFKTTLISVGGAGCDEWPERIVSDTLNGETEFFKYFGYGEKQTMGILRFDKTRPNELKFDIIKSADGEVIDTVTVTRDSSIVSGRHETTELTVTVE
jgi:hypothetical protein